MAREIKDPSIPHTTPLAGTEAVPLSPNGWATVQEIANLAPSGGSGGGSGGSIPVYNVKVSPYNATGNGVTDDSAAIQSAINAAQAAGGGIVYLPPGSYRVNTGLSITGNGITFQGSGVLSTFITVSQNSSIIPISAVGSSSLSAPVPRLLAHAPAGLVIRDLAITQGSPSASSGTPGMYVDNYSLSLLENVSITNFDVGFHIGGVLAFRAANLFAACSGGSVGIHLDGSLGGGLNSAYFYSCIVCTFLNDWLLDGTVLSDVYLVKCEGDDAVNGGLIINGASASNPTGVVDIHVINCVWDGGTTLIENMPSGTALDINGGWFNTSTVSGPACRIVNSAGVIVRGLQCYNGTSGISIENSFGITVADCIIHGSVSGCPAPQVGIQVISGSSYCTIHGNTIAENMVSGSAGTIPHGIWITGSSHDISLAGNTVFPTNGCAITSGIQVDTGSFNVPMSANIVTATTPYVIASGLAGISIMATPLPIQSTDPGVHGMIWVNSSTHVLTMSTT